MPFESTKKLTQGVAAGDPAAIEAYYRRYFDLMYREARRCIGADESTGLDLVQDAIVGGFLQLRSLRRGWRLEAWHGRNSGARI